MFVHVINNIYYGPLPLSASLCVSIAALLIQIRFRVSDLGSWRRIRFLKQRPDPWLDVLPTVELAVLVRVFETESLHYVLLGQFVSVEVEAVEDLQRFLCVTMSRVRHPAARFYLVRIEAPEVQFLFEQWTAHVGRVVQLPGAIVVEYLLHSR